MLGTLGLPPSGATYTLGNMEKGTKMRMSLLAVLAVAFVLALGGTALAQDSPTQDAYGGVLGNEVENNVTGEGGRWRPS